VVRNCPKRQEKGEGEGHRPTAPSELRQQTTFPLGNA
jgi:hypothetical protein